jgi:hypothetical protein
LAYHKHIKDGGHSMIADVSMVNELLATTITSIYLLSYKRVNKHDIFADVSGGHEKIFATAKF